MTARSFCVCIQDVFTNYVFINHDNFFVAVGEMMMTPRKSLKQLDLPVGLFVQPKSQDTSEIENKMKEIMQLSGILSINGKVSA